MERAAGHAVRDAGGGRVHVKLDSGMGRLGTRDEAQASQEAVAAARQAPEIELVGVMTHFATADDLLDGGFFDHQLEVFGRWARQVKAEHPQIVVHAANSAGTLRDRGAHFACALRDRRLRMDPFGEDPNGETAEPAPQLSSRVAEAKACRIGQSAGYGRRFIAEHDTKLAVLPIGYGDGFRRGLSNNADVLIDGRRWPLVGTVSMDNLTVELGPGRVGEPVGHEAVLIGTQGEERITAEELAARLQTINYEVTCALTPRVPRLYHRDGSAV